MAKAKKQDAAAGAEAGEKPAAKQPAAKAPKAKAPAAKKAAGGGAGTGGSLGMPLIDTDLAAEAAARMVLGRAAAGTGAGPAAPQPQAAAAGDEAADKRETSTFKQLKQGLNKPTGGLGGILGGAQQAKKSNQAFGGPNQQVRNQTFGADVSRSGVPRRTGG